MEAAFINIFFAVCDHCIRGYENQKSSVKPQLELYVTLYYHQTDSYSYVLNSYSLCIIGKLLMEHVTSLSKQPFNAKNRQYLLFTHKFVHRSQFQNQNQSMT